MIDEIEGPQEDSKSTNNETKQEDDVGSGAPAVRSTVYAVDFNSQAAGKRIATTKRRIRW